MKKTITILLALVVCTAISVRADTLAQWTFETTLPAGQPGAGVALPSIAPEVGGGAAFGFHAGDSTYSNPVGNGSAESFSSTAWAVGDLYQFQFSTVGYTGIAISFDHTSSSTGPRDFTLSYSRDGSPFTDFGSYSVLANAAPNPTWTSGTYNSIYTFFYDLSGLVALDNATTVDIRLANSSTVSAGGGTVAAGGTSRIDNFAVYSPVPVPEPSTVALALLGGVLGLARLRRKR